MNRSTRPESADPFAMQLALSGVHARLVPMQRGEQGYILDPSAEEWLELPASRGFAGYGLDRALRMLLDVLRGLTALHDTFDAEGVNFAHGDVALTQLRVDHDGVCRLVPLTARHSSAGESRPPTEALGHLAPERLLGEEVDARADVFSAGVLLWEALAGRRLFSETNAEAIIDRLMAEKLAMPQLPPELAWAIPLKSIAARALSVDPYQRFSDCAELATAIAIVARERVATNAEIATFLGIKPRSHNSVAQPRPRPVPARSSTFPSVSVPASPASVSGTPSSRNGFPLARPASRAVTLAPPSVAPAPRSITPVPGSIAPAARAVTLAPRSATPAPGSVAPAARAITLVPGLITMAPRSATPVPGSVTPSVKPVPLSSASVPESQQRPVAYKSPFATLLGAGENVPGSHRRKTLTSVGTPLAALGLVEAAPASSPASSKLPPPMPVWSFGLPAALASTSASTIEPRATLESIPLADEVAKLRGGSSRRRLIVLAALALAGVIALLVVGSSGEAPGAATNAGAQAQLAGTPISPRAVVPEPAATTDEEARPRLPPMTDSRNSATASPTKDVRPAVKAAAPTKPASASGMKDYGI